MEIFPSLISGDILNLEKTIQTLSGHCDGFHVDVMDDHFVPNMTFGPMFVNRIVQKASLPLHVHLMVDNPAAWIDRLKLRPIDIFIFHLEAALEIQEVVDILTDVKQRGCKVGVAIKPKTEVKELFDILTDLDHVLIMSVNPGFSGQKFMPEVVNKIAPLINKRNEMYLGFTIGMDGGIDTTNIRSLKNLGVDQFGVASAVFAQPDPIEALENLYNAK
jgi:ribulose-phosphate 3-epimerase